MNNKKDKIEWHIEEAPLMSDWRFTAHIDGMEYLLDNQTAAICNSILLLVDAINDKSMK